MSRTFFLCLAGSLFAAPAPLPPVLPATPAPAVYRTPFILGDWHMTWQNGSGSAHFAPDGTLCYWWCGRAYFSRWEWRTGLLCVWDGYGPDCPPPQKAESAPHWMVLLVRTPDGCLEGYTSGGRCFVRLEALK